MPIRFRHLLQFQRLAFALAGVSLGILTSILANWLSDRWEHWIPVLLGASIVSVILAVWAYARQPVSKVDVVIHSPITLRDDEEARRYARHGFIGFVPLFTPQATSPAKALAWHELESAIENRDFERLAIEQSNLQPMAHAIMRHRSKLQHCWLLTSTSENRIGSLRFAGLLADYLRSECNVTCTFHYGEAYTINLDNDAEVFKKTYDLVQRLFDEALEQGIKANALVLDITAGIRSMALGATLACLDAEHDIEFVGSAYDEQGKPTGPLQPILLSFEAQPRS